MDAVAKRLHQLIVQALLERDHDVDHAPVTVAEIYQELVPYRAVRERLGVELNADYEHALLRLLAGEDDLMRLEPASARDELRQELTSPNPYVGIYRKFAACDVWVRTDTAQPRDGAIEGGGDGVAVPAVAPSAGPEIGATTAVATPAQPSPASRPVAAAPAARDTGATASQPMPSRTATSTGTRARADARSSTACHFCSKPLPTGRVVRFCPYCGNDQSLRPCGKCGEILEQSWKYCIACGEPAADEKVVVVV